LQLKGTGRITEDGEVFGTPVTGSMETNYGPKGSFEQQEKYSLDDNGLALKPPAVEPLSVEIEPPAQKMPGVERPITVWERLRLWLTGANNTPSNRPGENNHDERYPYQQTTLDNVARGIASSTAATGALERRIEVLRQRINSLRARLGL
jgi:hypothetical protein